MIVHRTDSPKRLTTYAPLITWLSLSLQAGDGRQRTTAAAPENSSLERLVSGYSMAKSKNADYAEISFQDFIIKDVLMKVKENKGKEKFREMNPHWRPYNTYCAFCNIPYSVRLLCSLHF